MNRRSLRMILMSAIILLAAFALQSSAQGPQQAVDQAAPLAAVIGSPPMLSESAGYRLLASTVGVSAPASMSSNHHLQATMGQPSMIGQISSASYALSSGYWAVSLANDPPVAVDDMATTDEGTPVVIDVLVNDADVDGDVLTAQVVSGSDHGTLDPNADGTLTYTPEAGYEGPDSFTYRASDGSLVSSVATVAIIVRGRNIVFLTSGTYKLVDFGGLAGADEICQGRAEAAGLPGVYMAWLSDAANSPGTRFVHSDAPYSMVDGTELAADWVDLTDGTLNTPINVTESGSPGGVWAVWTRTTVSGEYAGACGGGDGTVVGASNHSDGGWTEYSCYGSDWFLPLYCFRQLSVSILTAEDDAVETKEDSLVVIDVLDNDADSANLPLSIYGFSQPEYGQTSLQSDPERIVYTPKPDFNGTDTFAYFATNGIYHDVATVIVTVAAVNDPPVARDDMVGTAEDVPVSIDVLSNDSDVDGDTLSVGGVFQPLHGTTDITGDLVVYTPTLDYNGSDSFTYQACDPEELCDWATMTINITPTHDQPVAEDQSVVTEEDTAVSFTLTTTDVDGDALNWNVMTSPAHGSLSGAASELTYTPEANYHGDDSFTYVVNDGTVDSDVATVSIAVTPAADRFYVKHDAVGNNDGTSWVDAFTNLQSALSVAGVSDEIWVAAGTYKPTLLTEPEDSRSATFQLESGVALYGGFVGTESVRGQRDWVAHATVLSGDIGMPGANGDNSYHVVTGSGTDTSALLDGFTITGGNANNGVLCPGACGGGMHNDQGNPTLVRVSFRGNSASAGGGIFNWSGGSTLINVTFSGNVASGGYGGGMGSYRSNVVLVNGVFSGNSATYGGGIFTDVGGGSTLINVTFSANSATDFGGGMCNWGGSRSELINVTFSGNSATYGGGMFNHHPDTSTTLVNNVFWGNTAADGSQLYRMDGTITVRYSLVQGGWPGTGNRSADPLFVDADGADNVVGTPDDDLRLRRASPAIDAGDSRAVPADSVDLDGDGNISEPLPFDLSGYPRFVELSAGQLEAALPHVDMGAYEAQSDAVRDLPGDAPPSPMSYPTGENDRRDDTFVRDDLDQYRFKSQGLGFDLPISRFYPDLGVPEYVTLRLLVWDVDFPHEINLVYVNDHLVGSLTGADKAWTEQAIQVPSQYLNFPADPGVGGTLAPAHNEIRIAIDVESTQDMWGTAVAWAELRVPGVRPVLLVPGLQGDKSVWDTWRVYLAADGIPHHAISGYLPNGPWTNAFLVHAGVEETKKRFGVDKVNVVSHSKGGLDSRAAIALGETSIEKLVMIGTPNAGTEILNYVPPIFDSFFQLTPFYVVNVFNKLVPLDPTVTYYALAGDVRQGEWRCNDWFLFWCRQWVYEWQEGISLLPGPDDKIVSISSVYWRPASGNFTHLPVEQGWNDETHAYHNSLNTTKKMYDRVMRETKLGAFDAFDEPVSARTIPLVMSSARQSEATFATDSEAPTTNPPPVAGTITAGEVQEATVTVDSALQATFSLVIFSPVSSEGGLDFVLYDPTGRRIDPATPLTDPTVVYIEHAGGSGSKTYSVVNPVPGSWRIEVTGGSGIPDSGSLYYVTIDQQSDLGLSLSTDAQLYPLGAPVLIAAEILENGSAVGGASVTAVINTPAGTTESLILYDDGAHDDGSADDGVYATAYAGASDPGHYLIAVTALGTASSGASFSRSVSTGVSVSPGTATLGDTYADQGLDTDGDGLFDSLAVDVGVEVHSPGVYAVVASLTDDTGSEIDATVEQVSLMAGVQDVRLRFDGRLIAKSGLNGPYYVKTLILFDTEPSPVQLDERADAWTTAAYSYLQFDRPSGAKLLGNYADQGVDADDNGLYDTLVVSFDVDAVPAGSYVVRARLADVAGAVVDWDSRQVELSLGVSRVELSFDGTAIAVHGAPGPYSLQDLTIYYLSYPDITAQLADPYTTFAYDPAQFDTRPNVTADPATQEAQYSDLIVPVTISAMDVAGDEMSVTTSWKVSGGEFAGGLPGDLALLDDGCSAQDGANTCTWILSGVANVPAGEYIVRVTVQDDKGSQTDIDIPLTILPEDASGTFQAGNPVAVRVVEPGGDSGSFELEVRVREIYPDHASNGTTPYPGDIGLGEVSMRLVPTGPGSAVVGTCTLIGLFDTGYDAFQRVTCGFSEVPVNIYVASVTVDGEYYAGSGEDVVVVYDPRLGFATGGGSFYWPGTENPDIDYPGDVTHFAFTMKYNPSGTNVKGSLLLFRHLLYGLTYQVKSNALYGLSLGTEEDDGETYGWASFSGKATYLEPDWPEPEGNHEFLVYVEDRDEPGTGIDRFWIEVKDKVGNIVPVMSMDRKAMDNAEPIDGGNCVVPHP